MRKLVSIMVLGFGVMGAVAPALAYDDNEMPPGLWKFSRGVMNIGTGLPQEVVAHTIGQTTEYGEDTLGGFFQSVMTGTFIGLFWGVARVGSGIVDVFTFPIPFNDNQPLVEPEEHV